MRGLVITDFPGPSVETAEERKCGSENWEKHQRMLSMPGIQSVDGILLDSISSHELLQSDLKILLSFTVFS